MPLRRPLFPTVAVAVAAILAAAAPPPVRAQVLVGPQPSGVAAPLGGQAIVPIVADVPPGGQGLGAFQLRVTWDQAVLKYVGYAPGAFGSVTVNEGAAATGVLDVAGARPQGAFGMSVLVQVTFEMLSDTGSSAVSVSSVELTEAGTFAVLGATPVPGAFCANTGQHGDVDRSGAIFAIDALVVVTAAVGLPIAPNTLLNADVDADGKADTRDALIILSHAVGLPTPGFRVGQDNTGACAVVPVVTLVLAPATADLAPGDAFPFEPQARDAAGRPIAAPGLAWTSSDPSVTVDTSGRALAVAVGSATITARALGGPVATAGVVVGARHVWYADAVRAAGAATELGSSAFPFSTIAQALAAAAPGDTVLVGAGAVYPGFRIDKPLVVVGDSGFAGMPAVKNATGAAIVSNTAGRVVIRRLVMQESDAGLEATGDSIEIVSVAAVALRGPAFRIKNMRLADLRGVRGEGMQLAGVFTDSTRVVRITGADFRLIEPRGDSAAGVAVIVADSVALASINVFGIVNQFGGAGIVVNVASHVTINGFGVSAAGGVNLDSVGYASIANGFVRGGSSGDFALDVSADETLVTLVNVRGVEEGVRIRERTPEFRSSTSSAKLTAVTVDSVAFGAGIAVTGINSVVVENTNISHVFNGIGLFVDPTASLVVRGGRVRAASREAIYTDSVRTVSLVGVSVDSSAAPTFDKFNQSLFAITVLHADSVRLDALTVSDNYGGGILVDEARVVTGAGSMVARNQGQAARFGECEIKCYVDRGAPALSHPSYFSTAGPGMALAAVQDARLSQFVVDSNPWGGLDADMTARPGPTLAIQGGLFRGGAYGVRATGDTTLPSGSVSVDGTKFANMDAGIEASYFDAFALVRARFDSVPYRAYKDAVNLSQVTNVVFADDTLSDGLGTGLDLTGSGSVNVERSTIRGFKDSCGGDCGDVALLLNGASVVARVYGSRLEQNQMTGVLVYPGITGTITFDSLLVVGHFLGMELSSPATVRQSLFEANGVGISVSSGGEASRIEFNNFQGNTSAAVSNQGSPTVGAPNNWWHHDTGPSGCLSCSGVGDAVSENVIFDPWLIAPYGLAPKPALRIGDPRRAAGGVR